MLNVSFLMTSQVLCNISPVLCNTLPVVPVVCTYRNCVHSSVYKQCWCCSVAMLMLYSAEDVD